MCTGDWYVQRASPRFNQGSIQAEPCARSRSGPTNAQKRGPSSEPALDDAEDAGVEVLDADDGSQEVAVAAEVGDVGADEEARGPADGHRQVGVRG